MKDKKFITNIGKTKLVILQGDITKQNTDVLVNAANSQLIGGGGVDGAIHRAGGPLIMAELRKKYRNCPTGDLVVTEAGQLAKLSVKKIFHAVGPIWNNGKKNEEFLLGSCYRNSIKKLFELKMKSISFPSISTGVYGYPIKKASKVALASVIKLLTKEYQEKFDEVRFVLFSENDFNIYSQTLNDLLKL